MKQRQLQLLSSGAVPMQSNHERQIACSYVEMPKLPVDEIRFSLPRPRKQKIPCVSVAVDDGQRALVQEAQPGPKRGVEHLFEHKSIFEREILAEIFNEPRQVSPEAGNHIA